MSADWQKFALTDLYDISSGLSKPAEAFGSGYPFVSFKDVFGNYFLPRSLSQLVESTEKERHSCSVKRGDVFLTRTSETMHELGMSSVALNDYPNATFNGFTKRLRLKESSAAEVHPEFIGYCLRSPKFRTSMLAFSTMSTRASLNNDMISRLNIKLPPIKTQKEIAKVLRSLDNKIHINTQTNQTLESIAQAIFKSWFVDFEPVKAKMAALAEGGTREQAELAAMGAISGKGEAELAQLQQQNPEHYQQLAETAALFPSAMVESELGEIPEGWEVSEIGNEVDIVGGGTPSTTEPSFWEDGEIHWTTPKDLSNNKSKVLLNTERKITEAGLAKISSGLLPVNTVLMSSRAPVGYLALAKIPVAVNQGYIAMKCNSELSPEFIILWAESVMDEIQQRASGTTFAEISKKTFRSIPLIKPNKGAINKFTEKVHTIFNQIASHETQTQTLIQLRDSLLPRLLSGEITVDTE